MKSRGEAISFPDEKESTPLKWHVGKPGTACFDALRLPQGHYYIYADSSLGFAVHHVAFGLRKEDAELIVRLVNGEREAE